MTEKLRQPDKPIRPAIPARPFREVDVAHTVVRALQDLNYDVSDKEKFLKRAQHVDFGLSAEVEFAAIAAWLGRCALIHRLDQNIVASADAAGARRVPDLLLVVEFLGERLPLLVEVKTTDDPELSLRDDYLGGLRRYAETIRLPLLIAWKPRPLGTWFLFDSALAVGNEHHHVIGLGPVHK